MVQFSTVTDEKQSLYFVAYQSESGQRLYQKRHMLKVASNAPDYKYNYAIEPASCKCRYSITDTDTGIVVNADCPECKVQDEIDLYERMMDRCQPLYEIEKAKLLGEWQRAAWNHELS